MQEEINHPARYNRGGIEVWEIEKAYQACPDMDVQPFVEHLRMGALEYILRCWDKGGFNDIRKAVNLLQRLLMEEVNR